MPRGWTGCASSSIALGRRLPLLGRLARLRGGRGWFDQSSELPRFLDNVLGQLMHPSRIRWRSRGFVGARKCARDKADQHVLVDRLGNHAVVDLVEFNAARRDSPESRQLAHGAVIELPAFARGLQCPGCGHGAILWLMVRASGTGRIRS